MEANTLEEPGAIIPHTGICAGGRVTGISTVTTIGHGILVLIIGIIFAG